MPRNNEIAGVVQTAGRAWVGFKYMSGEPLVAVEGLYAHGGGGQTTVLPFDIDTAEDLAWQILEQVTIARKAGVA